MFTDYVYHRREGTVFAERAFALFLSRLAFRLERMVIAGRLAPDQHNARYPLAREVVFVPLPYYPSLTHPIAVLRAGVTALRRFDRALADVDTAWLLGPSPFSVAFALLAMFRRRRVLLGVRQDYRRYLRARHPTRRWVWVAGWLLDGVFKLLSRRAPVVAVGPQIADEYADAVALLQISVSLTSREDVVAEELDRDYGGPLEVLSVGRLEEEKNPLLLAEVLTGLREDGRDWRLVVCGEGSLEASLRRRLDQLGVGEHARLLGYVEHESLRELYRGSHFMLHVSRTEGLPQILVEAFAAGLPTVATDVGGIGAAVDGAARLIPPERADVAVDELRGLLERPAMRRQLLDVARQWALEHSSEREQQRLLDFLAGSARA